MSPKYLPLTQFYRFENILYFIKHDPEDISFIQIGTFIFHKKLLTTRVAVNFIDETIYSTSMYH